MDEQTLKLFQDVAAALGVGLLVGLQRQRTAAEMAGVRSFALVTVLGVLTGATAAKLQTGWIVVGPLIGLATMILVHGGLRNQSRKPDEGFTTELALLLMYGVGVFLSVGQRVIGVAVGALVAVLLQFKPELHSFARRIGRHDMRAIMQFALITFIVLPALPRKIPGLPEGTLLDVVNPYEVWWLVVLIVGINLFGYAAYKIWGVSSGTLLNGVLGGLISSTATTVGNARIVRARPRFADTAAVVIAMASSIVCLRVLFEVVVVEILRPPAESTTGAAGKLTSALLLPAVILFAASVVPALVAWFRISDSRPEPLPEKNPTQLRAALVFAGAYAVILVALDAAHVYLPGLGPYVVAALSGLTDVDAVTLSTARLVGGGTMSNVEGVRLILLAILSNLIFKWCMAAVIGRGELMRRLSLLFAVPAVTCAILLVRPPPAIELPTLEPKGKAVDNSAAENGS